MHIRATCMLALIFPLAANARRFQSQGPILTLTLKDPYHQEDRPSRNINGDDIEEEASAASSKSNPAEPSVPNARWWRRRANLRSFSIADVFDLQSLAPNLLYAIRTSNPLPNYVPALQQASLTAQYVYNELKGRPNYIEGDITFHTNKLNGINLDIGTSYNVADDVSAVTVRLGSSGDTASAAAASPNRQAYGCFGTARFIVAKGKKRLSTLRASYHVHLPFQNLGEFTITPEYNFDTMLSSFTCVGKSGSGRTAAVLDVNWDNPTLSVVHAIDERNTIQPEISLMNAKILYNWSMQLKSGGILKTSVDPTEAMQITWIDQTRDGKWVTDFKLPLVVGQGPLAGDIRVRRQFTF